MTTTTEMTLLTLDNLDQHIKDNELEGTLTNLIDSINDWVDEDWFINNLTDCEDVDQDQVEELAEQMNKRVRIKIWFE